MKRTQKEIVAYIVCGLMTTAVNFIAFQIAINLGVHVFWAGIVSVTAAKIFAYVSNKLWVFRSRCATKKELGKEMLMFALVRGASGVVDVLMTWGLTLVIPAEIAFALPAAGIVSFSLVCNPATMAKIATQAVVIVMNFVLGKFFVFRSVPGTAAAEGDAGYEEEQAIMAAREALQDGMAAADMEVKGGRARDFVENVGGSISDIFSRMGGERDENSLTFMERLGEFFSAEYWLGFINSDGLKTGPEETSGPEGFFATETEEAAAEAVQKGIFWTQVANRVCGLVALLFLALALFMISYKAYSKTNLSSERLYHQSAMFQPETAVGKGAPNCGAVFSFFESSYANLCASINSFPNLTASQYWLLPLGISLLVLAGIFLFAEAAGFSVSCAICIGLFYVAVLGRASVLLDGGLFALQSLLLLAWLFSWRMERLFGASLSGIFRCAVLALMCGMPGLTSIFAAFGLALELVLSLTGVLEGLSGRRRPFWAMARVFAVLLAGLFLYWCWGGLKPPFGEIGSNFWMRFAESPLAPCPFLTRARTLVLICAGLSLPLVFLKDYRRCGLAGLFAALAFFACMKLAPGIDQSTLAYAGGAVAVLLLAEAGLVAAALGDFLSRLFCQYFEFPFLRFAVSAFAFLLVVLPASYVCSARHSASTENKTSYIDPIVAKFKEQVKGGDILVFAQPDEEASGAIVMRSIYSTFRKKLKKNDLKNVNVLDGNDFMGQGTSFFMGREAKAFWLVTAPASEDFTSLEQICKIEVRSADVALLSSCGRMHSAQELAASSAAIYGLCKSDWTQEPISDAYRALAFLPSLSRDCYLNPTLVTAYRLGVLEGLGKATPQELRSSMNDYGLARAAVGCSNQVIYAKLLKRLPATSGDFPLICQVWEKYADTMQFIAPEELTNAWSLTRLNIQLETERLDRIYDKAANAALKADWQAMKADILKDSAVTSLSGCAPSFKDCVSFLNKEYPNGVLVGGERGELLGNNSFAFSRLGWRCESVIGNSLSQTYISFPPLRVLVENEAGAESGLSCTVGLKAGVYLFSGWARLPEGREVTPKASLMLRPKVVEAKTCQVAWDGLQNTWSQQTLCYTNDTECSVNVFVGLQGSGRPGAAEFTGLTLRKLDEGEEWKLDPRMVSKKRRAGERTLYLDEQEEILNRRDELDFEKAF